MSFNYEFLEFYSLIKYRIQSVITHVFYRVIYEILKLAVKKIYLLAFLLSYYTETLKGVF